MFEHPERVDPIVSTGNVAVIIHQRNNSQTAAALAHRCGLVGRNGDASDTDAILFGGVLRGAAPAAADVQHSHPRLEAQFATHQIQLVALCRGKIRGVLPISAAIDHSRIEHGGVQIVAGIVVLLADLVGPAPGLRIAQRRREFRPQFVKSPQAVVDLSAQQSREHLVQMVAVPPAVHVGLARAQRAVSQNAPGQARAGTR